MSDPYGPREIYSIGDVLDMEVSPDDEMFIWEFPVQDRTTNPDLEPNWK